MRTSTWPGPAFGSGTSSSRRTSGPPNVWTRIAFMARSPSSPAPFAAGTAARGGPPSPRPGRGAVGGAPRAGERTHERRGDRGDDEPPRAAGREHDAEVARGEGD